MGTHYALKPKPIDKQTSKKWALASLGSAGIGVAGVQLFDLVNRETHRAHRLALQTGGVGFAPIFTGSFGASDYVDFVTPRPVSFFDFDGARMSVRETNAGLYSWTTVSIWGITIKISGGGFSIPGLGVSTGNAKIHYSDGKPLGDPNLILTLPNSPMPPVGPNQEIAKLEDMGIRMPGDVLFDFDKYLLKPGWKTDDALSKMLTAMDWDPKRRWLIEGHTDSVGRDSYNKVLGKRRAETVKAWVLKHMPSWHDAIKTRGVGESEPIATNETREGRAQNRRVEVWSMLVEMWNKY